VIFKIPYSVFENNTNMNTDIKFDALTGVGVNVNPVPVWWHGTNIRRITKTGDAACLHLNFSL